MKIMSILLLAMTTAAYGMGEIGEELLPVRQLSTHGLYDDIDQYVLVGKRDRLAVIQLLRMQDRALGKNVRQIEELGHQIESLAATNSQQAESIKGRDKKIDELRKKIRRAEKRLKDARTNLKNSMRSREMNLELVRSVIQELETLELSESGTFSRSSSSASASASSTPLNVSPSDMFRAEPGTP